MTVISPNVLEFKAPFTEPSTEYLTITNDSDETIAFKIKTTAPKVYCVRPNAAALEPGKSIDVSIILLGLKEEPASNFKCNDRFLIVSLPSPYDLGENKVAEIWPKLEAEFKDQSVSKKIKVKYLIAEEEVPATNQENVVAPTDSKSATVAEKEIKEKNLGSAINDQSVQDRSKIDELNEKLDSNVAAKSSVKSKSTPSQKQVTSSSTTPITTVLLIALIAFIIGWLFF